MKDFSLWDGAEWSADVRDTMWIVSPGLYCIVYGLFQIREMDM